MIRIHLDSKINDLVEEFKPGWLSNASTRTANFNNIGYYEEESSSWSKIKPVFMRLQFNKCAYCERVLAGETAGKGEHDLEHYRPKKNAKFWPSKTAIRKRKLDYGTMDIKSPFEGGYHWLAYNLKNYVTACTGCNSALKSSYFPIAGIKGDPTLTVKQLNSCEKPFLIYPLGNIDSDPESIITFHGAIAIPKKRLRQNNKNRARINIDFFKLNEREELLSERFRCIREYWGQFERHQFAPIIESKQDAKRAMDELKLSDSPHSSCIRAFGELCDTNIAEAYNAYRLARRYAGPAHR